MVTLSPVLFFSINELAVEICSNGEHGIQLFQDVVQLLILFCTDNVAFMSYSSSGLHKQINILRQFADKVDVSGNLEKTENKSYGVQEGCFSGCQEILALRKP